MASMKHNRAVLVLAFTCVFAAAGLAVGFVLPGNPFRGQGDAGRGAGKSVAGPSRDSREWRVYDALRAARYPQAAAGGYSGLYSGSAYGDAGFVTYPWRAGKGLDDFNGSGKHGAPPGAFAPRNPAACNSQLPDLHPGLPAWPDTTGHGDDGDWVKVWILGPVFPIEDSPDNGGDATPLPGAVWLLGSGLAVLGWVRKKQLQ